MTNLPPDVKSIFGLALEIESPVARAAYLEQACGTDAGLRAEVEGLLATLDRASEFMRRPAAADAVGLTARYEPVSEGPGAVIGPYKLMEQIGEGGFGLVFVAEQQTPVRRKVALKIVKPGMDSREIIARFEAERQALALMDHPNIAKVFDAGTTETGRPYFVMELVKGISIIEYCDEQQLTTRDRLELFVSACQAVQHAHNKGIIHRDLKPSNILVAPHDGLPVVKIIDFGIAKAIGQQLTDKTIYTRFTQMIGTPLYMSPEQAEVNALDVDTRSDVYSLGVLLYELLTGTTPFERQRFAKAAYDEIRRIIKQEEPPKPSSRLSTMGESLSKVSIQRKTEPAKLSALVKGDLDWVVMKAIDKDRARRYDTASAFAADVRRFLTEQPIEARPPSAWYRFQKLARRNKVAILTTGLVAASLVVGAIASAWQAIRATAAERAAVMSANAARDSEALAQQRKREADDAKDQAERRRDELARLNENLRRTNYVADMNLARVAWDENNLVRTRELLDKYRDRPGQSNLRGFEWHYLRRLLHTDLRTIKAHEGSITAVAFMPDGKRLLTSGTNLPPQGMYIFEGETGQVKLWGIQTGNLLDFQLKGLPSRLQQVALSPDGTHLAATCWDHSIRVWDLGTGELFTLDGPLKHTAAGVRFSPDGKRLVSSHFPDEYDSTDETHSFRIWDLASRNAVVTIDQLPITSGAHFSPDGNLIAFCIPNQGVVRVVKAATGEESYRCKFADGYVMRATFTTDGKRLFAGGEKGIRVWDTATREVVAFWPMATSMVMNLALSLDGRFLASGGAEGAVDLRDSETGHLLHSFKGHSGRVLAMAFNPDGTRLATGGVDGTVRIWETSAHQEVTPIGQATSFVQMPELSPDGQTLLTGLQVGSAGKGNGKSMQLWDTSTAKPRGGPIEMQQMVRSYDWTGDGKRLFLADEGNTVTIVDVANSAILRTYLAELEKASEGQIVSALSPNEKWYAHSAPGKTIRVRDAQTGAEFRTIKGLDNQLHKLAFNADGSCLASAEESGVVKIWDIESGFMAGTTQLNSVYIMRLRFSPDGKCLAVIGNVTRSASGTVRILDAGNGREIDMLNGHALNVTDAVFSPDGQRLATASADRTIRIWDLNTAQEILKLTGYTGVVSCIRFAPDGHRLIGASNDRTISVWDAVPLPE